MKISVALTLFGLALGLPLQQESSAASPPVFNIGGKQYFAGTNSWWLSHLTSDADVDQAMSEIAKSGLKVTRVWGFGNANTTTSQAVYFQYFDTESRMITINNGANGIPRLDAVIAAAEKYQVQLVLPLLNNWDDLGGINIYCDYFDCTHETFWTHEKAQQAYQDYVSFIVNRYKQSRAIFAWELCNEPRCQNCDSSVVTNWASKSSAYIKSLDSSNRVSLGDEGWLCSGGDGSYAYSCKEGIDFEANLKIPTLDYGTFHLYPIGWGYNYTWGNQWITEHAAMATKYGKPIVLEEYGVESTASNRTAVLDQWQKTILDSDIAYDSLWQFGTTFADGFNPYDDFAVFYDTPEYQDVVVKHAAAMAAKPVKG